MKMKKVFCILLTLATLLAMVVLPVHADGPDTLQVLGASIRIDGTEMQGLRFVGRVSEHESLITDGSDNVNFGFLLIPSSAVTSTDITASTDDVKTVPAKRIMGQAAVEDIGLPYEPGYIYFSAVLLGIPQEFYGSEIIARAYAPNKTSSIVTRSVAQVADGISKMANAPADQKTVANNLLAVYNEVGIDMLLNASAFYQLITYPAYTGIATDSLYTVSVKQYDTTKNLTVYNQAADYVHFDKDSIGSSRALGAIDSNRRFCEFAFDWGPVTVNIRVNKKFNSYVVSPTSKGFASTYSNGVISVTLAKPEYFVVILDDDYNTALSVFADLPETVVPSKGASNVVYVDTDGSITDPSNLITYSGTHNEVMTITKNYAKVYIAPGAVLKKRIVITQKYDGTERIEGQNGYAVKVCGRGMILDPYSDIANSDIHNKPSAQTYQDSSSTKTVNSTLTIYSYSCTVEDIKIIDSREFNFSMLQAFCYVNHVKLLSSEMSTDGFSACSDKSTTGKGGTIENCFAYVGDNALVVQNDVGHTGYTFRNITVGTTCAALYPQHNANCTFEDIYVFRADDGLINVYENNVGSMNVTVNGLDALDCVKVPHIFGDNGSTGSDTKTFNLNNVVTRYTTGSSTSFTPGTYTSQYIAAKSGSTGYTINFTNLCVGGHRIGPDNDGSSIKVGSAYLGANSAGGTTVSGITFNFAHDSENMPAYVSVPANKTANYTGGANYVAGPIDTLKWTRYRSYTCDTKYSGGTYTITKSVSANTDAWGLTLNLTEYARANGTGTYNVTYQASVKTRYFVVKTPINSGATSCVASNVAVSKNTSKTISINVDDVTNYTWYVVVTLEEDDFKTYSWSSADIPSSFTVSGTNLVKA